MRILIALGVGLGAALVAGAAWASLIVLYERGQLVVPVAAGVAAAAAVIVIDILTEATTPRE